MNNQSPLTPEQARAKAQVLIDELGMKAAGAVAAAVLNLMAEAVAAQE